jgi:DNA-directed RNA polymerase specialized sigma24 family protein
MAAQCDTGLAATLLEEAYPIICGALRKKLHVTLRDGDLREQNLDALDLLGEVQCKLLAWIRKQEGDGTAGVDFKAYAATVAYHCCADYLRARYPQRTSLKNCLRRLLETRDGYGIWTTENGDLLCGFASWRTTTRASAEKIRSLQQQPEQLPPESLPRQLALSGHDWVRLLDAIFDFASGPISMDDLLAVVAPLTGVEDLPQFYDPEPADEEKPSALEQLATRTSDPYSVRLTVERLQLYWGAVLQLLPWHRAAYLLNLRDGDLDALPYYGVVTMEGIGDAIELKEKQMSTLEQQVGLGSGAGSRLRLGQRFVLCWPFLPLEDTVVALVLEVTRPQVIGYRTKARERLARSLRTLL